jgi:hypothetical protein
MQGLCDGLATKLWVEVSIGEVLGPKGTDKIVSRSVTFMQLPVGFRNGWSKEVEWRG